MSAVGGTSGTLKASKPRFSSQMKEFLALGKKVFHEKDIGDYDQLLDDKKELEEKLLSKSKELSSFQSSMEGKIAKLELSEKKLQERIGVLQSDKKTLLKEFGEQYKLWDTKTNRQTDLEKEVNSLQTMLTSANHTVESLHAQVGDLQNQVFDFQVANDKKDNEVKMARRELSSKERELTGATKDAELYQAQLEEQRKEVELESLDVLDM
jgi:chromosome segregation ATPase